MGHGPRCRRCSRVMAAPLAPTVWAGMSLGVALSGDRPHDRLLRRRHGVPDRRHDRRDGGLFPGAVAAVLLRVTDLFTPAAIIIVLFSVSLMGSSSGCKSRGRAGDLADSRRGSSMASFITLSERDSCWRRAPWGSRPFNISFARSANPCRRSSSGLARCSTAILIEAGLGFLGCPIRRCELGEMLNAGRNFSSWRGG